LMAVFSSRRLRWFGEMGEEVSRAARARDPGVTGRGEASSTGASHSFVG